MTYYDKALPLDYKKEMHYSVESNVEVHPNDAVCNSFSEAMPPKAKNCLHLFATWTVNTLKNPTFGGKVVHLEKW